MSSPGDAPFRRSVLASILVVGGVSMVAFLLLLAFGRAGDPVGSSGTDSYSRSAVGHRAFVALLRKLGAPVTVSRFASGARAGETAVLAVLEPRAIGPEQGGFARLYGMLESADTVLLALPKWKYETDSSRLGYVESAYLRNKEEVEAVLRVAGVGSDVVRFEGDPGPWTLDGLAGVPRLDSPQLMTASETLTPLVRCPAGILVGEVNREGRRIVVVSDPDLLSNHGIGDGDNALLAWSIVTEITGGTRPLIVDEILHGHESDPGVWLALLRFPLVLVTVQAVFVLVLLLWAATGRFGAPLPVGDAIEPGKGVLIANTADLLLYGGHSGRTLDQYFKATVRDAASALHAPPGRPGPAVRKWLADVAERRGVRPGVEELVEDLASSRLRRGENEGRVLAVANKIHRFREEILHGARRSKVRR